MERDDPPAIGPYELAERLGHGGMGVVYRGRHEATGTLAAVKTVTAGGELYLRALQREIHALAGLRHPGIVRILDEGIHAGLPWYAMELVDGVSIAEYTLRPLLRRKGKGRRRGRGPAARRQPGDRPAPATMTTETVDPGLLPTVPRQIDPGDVAAASSPDKAITATAVAADALQQLLTLIAQLCEPLAFLHGEGIVHGDLKPENILVRPDGTPVLVDFGLSAQYGGDKGRERLSLEAVGGGTVYYMAPERIRGDLVDARADLYSLGCIIHELCTGHTPFVGPPLQVLQGHLVKSAPPLSRYVTALPPELQALVDGLLAKEPRRRIGHADIVAARLVTMGANPGGRRVAARPTLYRSGLVGRARELAVFKRYISEASQDRAGSGRLILVGGESGVGKTRLVVEISREAEFVGWQVFGGGCHEHSREPLSPMRTFFAAVTERCRGLEEDELCDLFGSRVAVIARYVPALGDIPGLTSVLKKAPPEPDLPDDAARRRLFSSLWRLLTAVAEERPVFFIIDDLQWADELTLGFLLWRSRMLGREKAERAGIAGPRAPGRVIIMATYRSEEAGSALAALRQGADGDRCSHVELGRLEGDSIAAMIDDILALQSDRSPAVDGLVADIAERSRGNPFFATEYVRAAVSEGLLYRDDCGWWQLGDQSAHPRRQSPPLPGSLHDLIARRVAALPELPRQLLDIAAVIGRRTEASLLARVAGVTELRCLEGIKELMVRQIFEDTSDGYVWFVHGQLCVTAHERIPASRRQTLHLEVAEALAAATPNPLPDGRPSAERAAELGEHFFLGKSWARAAAYSRAAGEHSAALHAYADARVHYDRAARALAELDDTPDVRRQRIDTVLRQVQVSWVAEDPDVNLARLAEAEKLAESSGAGGTLQLAEIELWTGRAHFIRNNLQRALDYFERTRETAQRLKNQPLRALATSLMGRVMNHQGRFASAEILLAGALDALPGDVRVIEYILTVGHLGLAVSGRGRIAEGRALAETALERASTSESLTGVAISHLMLAFIAVHGGDMPLVIDHVGPMIAAAERSGDQLFVVLGNGLRGWAEARLGRHSDARASMEAYRQAARNLGSEVAFSDLFAAVAAEIALYRGDSVRAGELARDAARRAGACGSVFTEGIAERVCGFALAAQNPAQRDQAEAHLAASIAALDAGGAVLESARTHVAWGQKCLAWNDRQAALGHFRIAGRELRRARLQSEHDAVRELVARCSE